MGTLVYLNGGDRYMGLQEDKTLARWKKYGKELGMKYLYKGFHYYENKKSSVCTFDNMNWSKAEMARRKANGFLGIKKYVL